MALNPRAEQIYELADIWMNECLLADGSIFWPDRQVWTHENLDNFWQAFAGNLDEGDGSFIEKWAQQLRNQSDDVHRMAVDVAAIYCLFPASKQMGPTAKRKLISEVLEFSGDLGAMNPDRWATFEKAINGGGIGLTGAGYLAARPFHIGMYLGFAKTVKASDVSSSSEIYPKDSVNEALELVSNTMDFNPRSTKHILLHILWPEKYEDYASIDYKKKMAANLSSHFGLPELDDIDETILQARQHMEANGFQKDFSMYNDEIRPLWDNKSQPLNGPDPEPKFTGKFKLAAKFRERVLENNSSFLWPDEENVWTPENAQTALHSVKHLIGQSHAQATENLIEILQSADRPIYQILCDARVAEVLRAPLSRNAAQTEINAVLGVRQQLDVDQQAINQLLSSSNEYFPGAIRGSGGVQMINRFLVVLEGLTVIVSHPETIGDRDAMVQQFLNSGMFDDKGGYHFPFWALLYLMYPEQVASAPAWSSRQAIRRKFDQMTMALEFPNEMAELAHIRATIEPDFDPRTFDFFANPWKDLWSPDGSEEQDVEEGDEPDVPRVTPIPTIASLAAATFLDEDHLRDIESLLSSRKQLIFEGPPGSGKTFVAEKFARYFTEQPLTGERNDRVELVQFHQSYSYEDFVEGIRPETIDGQLHYNVKPGIFREFATKAWDDLENNYVLIIDEINRGNVSRILGELMLLLEYREERAKLPYSQKYLEIPPNLYIIGTMNSADRSLSQIDYALRRRFYFVRFLSVENGEAKVLGRWLDTQNLESDQRHRILHTFIELNAQLRSHLDTDDLQIGHSYFMNAKIGNEDFRKQVWKYAVIPLIREYLYHHRDRDELLQSYELQRLIRIVQPIADETGEPTERLISDSSGEELD